MVTCRDCPPVVISMRTGHIFLWPPCLLHVLVPRVSTRFMEHVAPALSPGLACLTAPLLCASAMEISKRKP